MRFSLLFGSIEFLLQFKPFRGLLSRIKLYLLIICAECRRYLLICEASVLIYGEDVNDPIFIAHLLNQCRIILCNCSTCLGHGLALRRNKWEIGGMAMLIQGKPFSWNCSMAAICWFGQKRGIIEYLMTVQILLLEQL